MLLTAEIILALALLTLFIYLKRGRAKTFIKKTTASRLFPKIFWGLVLGVGLPLSAPSTSIFLNTIIDIGGIHFVGPLFGIFAGITIGASSRPFSIKKLLYCICAGFIGGTIYLFLSREHYSILSKDIFTVTIFSLALMPVAIGIADKSLIKIIVGMIGGGVGIFFYFMSWMISYIVAARLADFFNPSAARGFGMPALFGWEIWPICVAIVGGGIFLVIGIELTEVSGIFKDAGDQSKKAIEE